MASPAARLLLWSLVVISSPANSSLTTNLYNRFSLQPDKNAFLTYTALLQGSTGAAWAFGWYLLCPPALDTLSTPQNFDPHSGWPDMQARAAQR